MVTNEWFKERLNKGTREALLELLDGLGEQYLGKSHTSGQNYSIRIDDYGEGDCEVFIHTPFEQYFFWVLDYTEMSHEKFHNIMNQRKDDGRVITNPSLYQKLKRLDTDDLYKEIL